jgi:hypothetical protein
VKGLRQWLDPQLGTVGINEADFTGSDSIVDPVLAVVGCSGYVLTPCGLALYAKRADVGKQRPLTAVDRPGRIP